MEHLTYHIHINIIALKAIVIISSIKIFLKVLQGINNISL